MTQDNAPRISVEAQYIKDLSFENPNSPASLKSDFKPTIEMSLDLHVGRIDQEKDIYEVSLSINATAISNEKILFVIELVYTGIFTLFNIPDQDRKFILGVHCPTLLFPFARQIIASTTQAGGFQPLMIDPIDFAALYSSKIDENNSDR